MARSIEFEGEYIVGGKANARVSPNFKLKEFGTPGSVRIARELVGALQELRDAHGSSVKITGLGPRNGLGTGKAGCFAFVTAADRAGLDRCARALVERDLAAKVSARGRDLYVECVDPANPPPLPAVDAMDRAIRVTAAYETAGDPFQQVTGNFDSQGLSFGPLQVNFGTGTLPALFERFAAADRHTLAACFGNPEDLAEWNRVLSMSRAKQVRWADGISVGTKKYRVGQPWRGYLEAVGRVPAFREVMMQYAYDVYGRKLLAALSWLRGLWPGRIDHFVCLAALYDMVVQQGGFTETARNRIRARVTDENPGDQHALVRIAVAERALTAKREYRADCLSRRLGILDREPYAARAEGRSSERTNRRIYLLRNTTVKGAESYLT